MDDYQQHSTGSTASEPLSSTECSGEWWRLQTSTNQHHVVWEQKENTSAVNWPSRHNSFTPWSTRFKQVQARHSGTWNDPHSSVTCFCKHEAPQQTLCATVHAVQLWGECFLDPQQLCAERLQQRSGFGLMSVKPEWSLFNVQKRKYQLLK